MAQAPAGGPEATPNDRVPGARTPSGGRAAGAFAFGFSFGVLFLVLFSIIHAQERQMRIFRNRTRALTSYEPAEPASGTSDAPIFKVVLQRDPFIEIQLRNPLSEIRLAGRQLRFFCEEVGVFKDQKSQKTWTIGKGCKPLPESQQNGR